MTTEPAEATAAPAPAPEGTDVLKSRDLPRYSLPAPRPDWLLKNLNDLRRDPIAFMEAQHRRGGDFCSYKFGPQLAFLCLEPEGIKDVLVTHARKFQKGPVLQRARQLLGHGLLTSEGEFHRRQRRLSQPAFHRDRIYGYGETMVNFAAGTRERWVAGVEFDVAEAMMRLTLAIVAKTLFDADVEREAADIGESLTTLLEMFDAALDPFYVLTSKFRTPATRRFEAARDKLNLVIYRIIRECRESGADRGDLLSMLVLATDAEGDGTGMTDEQLRDEALTLFLAGHETTANALTWTWYLLSQHPEVEARFHAEIDEVLGDRLPTAEDMPRLGYVRMVMSESMRLYPPAWTVARQAIEDHEVLGVKVPAKSIVMMPQYLMHRHPRFWQDPEKFDPERFAPDRKSDRPHFAYYPFGAGPRICIGESFAWMEGILLLATIGQKWRLRVVPGHPVERLPLVTLRPRHGMKMVAEARVSRAPARPADSPDTRLN
jgi:cytochrome P450